MASTSTRRVFGGEPAPSTPNGHADSALGLTGPQTLRGLRAVGRPAVICANDAQRSRQSGITRYKRSKGSSLCTSVAVFEQPYRGRSSRSGGAAATDDDGRRN